MIIDKTTIWGDLFFGVGFSLLVMIWLATPTIIVFMMYQEKEREVREEFQEVVKKIYIALAVIPTLVLLIGRLIGRDFYIN